ncbi:integrase catalytic domain-containing protein [Trichonephila inaurata madagascariensis]|uniref:Integrase catalytic domain-containing protein n=1 Tax=Trichonephila inaurata madagascariensis TaxID=2747483 RepID=A0A8X6X5F1_9ARAC|nr:integrase catalytic domain-containing protein [Trichonephila inaurata madagascariensis]
MHNEVVHIDGNVVTTLTMHVGNIKLADLWELQHLGVNLLEVIPDVLDRFRLYPIGLSADIEKAFLMLSVAPKDRDYLRFFYPIKEGELVYRHCRIVFGLNSSPFLLNASLKHLLDNAPSEYCDVVEKLKCSFYVDNCLSGVHNVTEEEYFIDAVKKYCQKVVLTYEVGKVM